MSPEKSLFGDQDLVEIALDGQVHRAKDELKKKLDQLDKKKEEIAELEKEIEQLDEALLAARRLKGRAKK